MTDHRNGCGSGGIIIGPQCSTKRGAHAEDVEVITCDETCPRWLSLARARNADANPSLRALHGAEPVEHFGIPQVRVQVVGIQIEGAGQTGTRSRSSCVAQKDELLRIGDRQRLQQRAADDGEDGRRRADAKRQRENGDR